MNAKPKKKITIWQKLLRVVIVVFSLVATSQTLTTDPVIDQALKVGVVQISNIVVGALSNDGADTIKIDTVTVTAVMKETTNN